MGPYLWELPEDLQKASLRSELKSVEAKDPLCRIWDASYKGTLSGPRLLLPHMYYSLNSLNRGI